MHSRIRWALLGLAIVASACQDAAIAPATGQLLVTIEGLPPDLRPSVIVTGPSGYRQVLDSSQRLQALPQGTFTLVPERITSGTVRYAGSPATQTVRVVGDTVIVAGPIAYAVGSARLSVTSVGLPTGTAPNLTVRGPDGFTRTLSADAMLDLLDPGSYTITAADIVVGSRTFRAVVGTTSLTLSPSVIPVVTTVEYGPGASTLRVNVTGLPVDIAAAIDVTGPNGFLRRVTRTAVLGRLEGGSYTLTAAAVGSVLTTHTPSPLTQSIVLTGSDTAAALVTYGTTPLSLRLVSFATGLTQPVYLTAPPGDTRQFIVERGGRIKVVVNGAVLATPFLDISSRVNNVGERGMLSMVFDPAYATNGYFYVYYVALNGNVVVERLSATPGANTASTTGTVVISLPHGGNEHHGGQIAFGPDSMFYFAPGDGACCGDPRNNAQNLTTLLGKMVRLNVRTLPYTVPADNPFVGQTGVASELFAYGLRNPWRFSIDAPSGMLYIGDVGQDAQEEVNVVPVRPGGQNFGWPFTEGLACYSPATNCTAGRTFTLPALTYPHSDGCAVTGGYVYRGRAMPELVGHYLYTDYCRGWLRSFLYANSRATEQRTWNGITMPFTSSFGQDGEGELYMIAGAQIQKLVRGIP